MIFLIYDCILKLILYNNIMCFYKVIIILRIICYINIIRFLNYISLISNDIYYNEIINIIQSRGIVFIKLIQTISSRKDITKYISNDLKNKLINMQDKCFFYKNRIFPEIDYISTKQMAAGSVCNVHLINYKNKKHVLKSIHININKQMNDSINDIKLLNKILNIFNIANILNTINLDKFNFFLKKQINLISEVFNQNIIIDIFRNYHMIHIPKIYEYNMNYIIMEYVEGKKYNEFIEEYPEYEEECIALIYSSLYKMIQNEFVHGDFHHGNFLFKLVDGNVHIIILDFGLMCHLTYKQAYHLKLYFNLKKKKYIRKKHFIKFIYEVNENIDLKNIDINTLEPKEIVLLIIEKKIELRPDLLSFFTTLQTLILKIGSYKKKNKHFVQYLLGYILDNRII